MLKIFKKIIKSANVYYKYFMDALSEVYVHLTSPIIFYIFLKKWALANRSLRIIWTPKSSGRRPLNKKIIELIIELKNLNPLWGAQKISNELSKIGYKVCKKTVLKYLEIYSLNSPYPHSKLTWSEFLSNHKFKIGIDFTSLISVLGHQLFIFVILNLDSRKLIFINVTCNPSAEWITQQFKNTFIDFDDYPSLCISDNDQIFQGWFQKMLKDYFDMKLIRTPFKSPEKNGKVERFHRSLKEEAFHNVVPINSLQAIRVCREYQDYYNHYRPHQGINGFIPDEIKSTLSKNKHQFSKKEHLGGKIISFEPEFLMAS